MTTFIFLHKLIELNEYNRKGLIDLRFTLDCALELEAINTDDYVELMNSVHLELIKIPFKPGIFG